MNKATLVLGLLLATSANAADKYVDIALFDTSVVSNIGSTSMERKACTLVLYGPEEGEINSKTFSGKSCDKGLQNTMVGYATEKGIGVYSLSVNGVEVMKGIKP